MAYSTRANVASRLSALEAEGADSITAKIDARIADGIEYADSIIDGKLAKRYTVPFADAPSTPKLIKNISADLAAAYSLDGGFSGGGEDEPTPLSDTVRNRAMALLCALAEGDMELPATVEPPPSTTTVVPYHSKLGQRPTLESFDLWNEPT